jgi:hypothetical protein
MNGLIIGFGLCAIVSMAADVQPDWTSPTGPDGVTRIIVEAEEMKGITPDAFGGTGPDWRVGRFGIDFYQNNVFGGHWQSRSRTAMTDKGANPAELTATIEVPSNGTYKLWVKYECPPLFNYAFDVSLRQSGFTGREMFRKTYGLIDSPKHFSFKKEVLSGSLYWNWGIDHDAAEGYDVTLEKGKYRLAIAKAASPEPAGMRSIDVVMLTSDLSPISSPRYDRFPLLDELRRANHVFMRFRVPTNAPAPLQISWTRAAKRYPDFYSPTHTELIRVYGQDGRLMATNAYPPLKRGQWTPPLNPGETGPWLDVGPCLNVENASTFLCTAAVLDSSGKKPATNQPAFKPFSVDMALAPSEKGIVKTFEVLPGEPGGLAFLFQPDPKSPEGLAFCRPMADIYRSVAEELDREPRLAPGLPRNMRFYGYTGSILGRAAGQDWTFRIEMDFRRAVGLNTIAGSAIGLTPDDIARQKAYYAEKGDTLVRSAAHHHSQDPVKIASNIMENGTVDDFYYLSFGDEIGLPAVDVKNSDVVEAFKVYLKAQGVTPESLGLPGWEVVKPLNSLSADVAVQIGVIPAERKTDGIDRTLKRLYWHSVQFRTKKGVEEFAAKTRLLREKLGPGANTSANLGGMHPFYWMHQSSFIESFKHNAMTVAWTEDYDYCQPEASRLVVEFQAGYLKCGAKYNGQRMMFYCMPHYPGQSPEHLLQNAILEIGQNVKDLDWFSIPPDGFTTENYINPRGGLPMFKMLRRVSDMAALTENWLDPARPVDAPVALLLSEASDLWEISGKSQGAVKPDSEETNAFQEERKNTYYALRNAGYRVDLITEADAREGWLARYKALYIGGENMERATAPAIEKWVRDGGILAASAGAARKDEYDEPFTGLDAVLGRGPRTAYDRYRGALRSKLELLFLKPLDTVKPEAGAAFPALAVRETFAAASNAVVLARFGDGSPAWVSSAAGRGTGYYMGTFPATAWLKPALPVMPCGKGGPETAADGSPRYPSFEPVAFDAVAGSAVIRPLAQAGIRPDIRIDKPHLAANRLTGSEGTVVTLVNLGRQQAGPAESVTLEVDGLSRTGRIWSYAFPKGLESTRDGNTLVIRLPKVELADLIVIEK